MKFSLKFKLIMSFLTVVLVTGIVTAIIGVHSIGDRIVKQAQEKVRIDLNSAREVYQENIKEVLTSIRLTAVRFFIKDALLHNEIDPIKVELETIRKRESLDVLNLTDKSGVVQVRTRNPTVYGDSQADDELISRVLSEKKAVASTQIISEEELKKEGDELVERAHLRFIPTPKARPIDKEEETSGMLIKAAAPIFDHSNNLIGVLYGGKLLNHNFEIVDKIKNIVYRNKVYKGKDIGTATIFQDDLRISTNVENADGSRAIGTRVSEEVYKQVVQKGKPWIARAFVVNDWYITAYEPIRNINNRIIGILYVGMLEQEFVDMRRQTLWTFLIVTFIGVAIALIISYFLGNNVLRPIRHLVFASNRLAKGDLSHRVAIKSGDEIGELGKTFNYMADSIKERDEKLKEQTKNQIMKSEKLAMIGRLAAGVAHEINNPLGGILVYSHLLLEDTAGSDPKRANLEKIIRETTRCKDIVRSLLDFARPGEPKIELSSLNETIEGVLSLVEKQVLFHNITIEKDLARDLPRIAFDKSQLQQVFMNIVLNAAEAMDGKGKLTIRTQISVDGSYGEAKFTDTGHGIPKENFENLFEPFFTTKKPGEGTGLGLSISYGIVKKHSGKIEVESEVGKGTTFTIKLPIKKEKSK
jgi:two-component system NtrC family sensor kinase